MFFQKKKKKYRVSINRSRSWFYFTDIHNRLNKSREYYLLKIVRNNPSTVFGFFLLLRNPTIFKRELVSCNWFFFLPFPFFSPINWIPSPRSRINEISIYIYSLRMSVCLVEIYPQRVIRHFDRISNFDPIRHEFPLLESLDPRDPVQGHSTTPPSGLIKVPRCGHLVDSVN